MNMRSYILFGTAGMFSAFEWVSLCLYIFCVSFGNINGYKQGNKCDKGQYKNEYLSGGCVKCPRTLQQCDNEEIDDARRCFFACRQILLSTAAPISLPTSVLPQTSTLPSRSVTPTTAKSGTKHFFEKITKVFNDTVLFPTKGYFPDKDSGQQNWTEITVGILISVVALIILVAAICLAIHCKKCSTAESNSDQRRRSGFYSQVSPQSGSNSDQSINNAGERLEITDEEAANSENNSINVIAMSSVSYEDFKNMLESKV